MNRTTRLQMPLIESGQVDKSTTHNEALAMADLTVCGAIDAFLTDTPPSNPTLGSSYVVGASPTGAWSGQALAFAGYTVGGWRFIAPFEGLRVIENASGELAIFRSGAWEKGQLRAAKLTVGGMQVVGARLAAVTEPTGGTVVDAEARGAIAAILARLRQHGLIAS